mmetsp:Transcript_6153/g.22505  ORF Transcript_6153/g.22505 Transcript_6153/m.22505 type:complete len:285 (+) Transcript_6153:481-1335(+)
MAARARGGWGRRRRREGRRRRRNAGVREARGAAAAAGENVRRDDASQDAPGSASRRARGLGALRDVAAEARRRGPGSPVAADVEHGPLADALGRVGQRRRARRRRRGRRRQRLDGRGVHGRGRGVVPGVLRRRVQPGWRPDHRALARRRAARVEGGRRGRVQERRRRVDADAGDRRARGRRRVRRVGRQRTLPAHVRDGLHDAVARGLARRRRRRRREDRREPRTQVPREGLGRQRVSDGNAKNHPVPREGPQGHPEREGAHQEHQPRDVPRREDRHSRRERRG